jgi:hypothetical protein
MIRKSEHRLSEKDHAQNQSLIATQSKGIALQAYVPKKTSTEALCRPVALERVRI